MSEPVHISEILPGVMVDIQKRRALARDGGQCLCGKPALIVCFRRYDASYEATLDDLVSLCGDCYERHEIGDNFSSQRVGATSEFGGRRNSKKQAL